jgi:hypothetical protein
MLDVTVIPVELMSHRSYDVGVTPPLLDAGDLFAGGAAHQDVY